MKIVLKENIVVQIIAVLVCLYDLSTLSLQALLITSIFSLALYYLTGSFYVLISVLLSPQVIRILNFLMGKKEPFIAKVANEVSDRVIEIKKNNPVKKVETPTPLNLDEEIEGTPQIPSFMTQYETLGVPVNINGRIPTQVEESIPAAWTVDRKPQENPFRTSVDTESIEVTMTRTLADKISSSDILGTEF